MILNETKLYIGDNSGAHLCKCIRILGTNKRVVATLGDYLVVVLPHRHLFRRLLTKNIYVAVLLTIKKNLRRKPGYYLKATTNKVALLSEQGKLIGNIIHGGVFTETLNFGVNKLVNYAKVIL